jgi:hypothetical protein
MSGTFQTKPELRQQWVRSLRDQDLFDLAGKLKAEEQRRRRTRSEITHRDPTDKIRWWRLCPICGSCSCRAQSCRDVERRLAQRRAW